MIYKFEMYFNDMWNDVSSYVETNATLGDRLNQTLNLGSFILPHIKADKFAGIDLSSRISPWIPVKITIDGTVSRFYTADCTRTMVKKTDPKLYRHEIGLIEPSKILQRKTIPDMTITQPKANIYIGSFSSNSTSYDPKIEENIYLDGNTPFVPTLEVLNQCEDLALIDGLTIKGIEEDYRLKLVLDVDNWQFNSKNWNWNILNGDLGYWTASDAESILRVEIFANGDPTPIYDEDHSIQPGEGNLLTYDQNDIPNTAQATRTSIFIEIPRTPTVEETYTFRYTLNGNWKREYGDNTVLTEDDVDITTSFTISTGVNTVDEEIYLDYVTEKVLNNIDLKDTNDLNTGKYRLDPNIIPRLSNELCPEFTFTNYKAWDALVKIANVVNAIPEIKDDFRTVTFRYLDEVPDLYYDQDMFEDETLAQVLDSTVSGLEVNAPNVIEEDVLLNAKIEPYAGGWASVRSNDELVSQLDDTNATFPTRQLIQKVYRLYIKGVAIKCVHDTEPDIILYGNSSTISNTTTASFWDISSRVVTDKEWATYPNVTANKNDVNRRDMETRGNHIYYAQGSKSIQGLGYKTLTTSDLLGSTVVPRAIIETLLSTCADYLRDEPSLTGYTVETATGSIFNNDPELAIQGTHDIYERILYRVEYVPLTNARTTVYKHDTFNTAYDLTDFVNEQDKLNDTINLGKFVSSTLNRQGNVEYTVSGQTTNYNTIPKLGYRTYSDLVVNSRDLNLNKNLISYTLNLSKEFINRSEYVGRKSEYRAFEIPSEDIVHRQDKYREFIVLTKDKAGVLTNDFSSLTLEGKQMLVQNFCNLAGTNDKPVSYGKIGIVKSKDDLIDYYDMPINTFALHTTVNLQFEFETNYSAGSTITDKNKVLDNEAIKFQEYIQYTNVFGKAYSIDIELFPGGKDDNDYLDADLYPKFNDNITVTNKKIVDLDFIINKDAREKYGINIEYPFITDDSSTIRTYQGIAKFNALVRSKENINVRIALFEYDNIPTLNQTQINDRMKKITDVLGSVGTFVYDNVNDLYGIKYSSVPIQANMNYAGYAVYEGTTNELIYVVEEDIAPFGFDYLYDTDTIWFIPRKYLKDNTRPTE